MPAREADPATGESGTAGYRFPDRNPGTQWVVTAAILITGALTIRPMGFGGRGLAVAALFAVNGAVLVAVRLVPENRMPRRFTLVLLGLGVVAAAALIGTSHTGTAILFAFFLAGSIGYRLDTGPALGLAALCSLLSGGALYLWHEPGQHMTTALIGFSTGFAALAGMAGRSRAQATRAAIAAAEAAERAARAEARTATLTERGRIARDVHDVLAHSLAGINMQLELADALLDAGDLARVREATRTAQSLVKESLKQAQWTVHALRADSLPLVESLTAMLESSGHRDCLTVAGEVRELPTAATHNLLRITQEALTNAARHAPGGDVAVTLTFTDRSTTLSIRNRPGTRPVASGPGSGMGLIGMRERVALLGGTITTGPVAEGPDLGGWHVEVMIPR